MRIRIGVTGHRVLNDVEKIEAGVETALRRIELKFPGEVMTAFSALAEGADRIVAWHILERPGATLIVSLPLPASDYLTDFESEASKTEFLMFLGRAAEVIEMPRAPSREHAYEAAGNYVLDSSDVLITIWDGREARGRGGTADIVGRARRRGLPIAWVHAGNCTPGNIEPASLGDEQGRVTFENI